MNLTELEQYFEEILIADIKAIPQKITTLFDIAGFPHRETVMSNFYAYYFDPNGQHQFGDLFISALSDIIRRKSNGSSIIVNSKNCYTEREVYTNNGKYIDIVVREPSEITEKTENAIIIENKVYAAVYNDLLDYYNFVNVNNSKIGIVLSLRPEQGLPEQYINITHDELLSQAEQSSGSYFLNADIKQIIILKEFIQNIKSMTQTKDINEQYEFYFKHQDKIKKISELYSTVKGDIFRQVEEVCDRLDLKLILKGKSSSQCRWFFSETAPLYFTIWLDNYFNSDGKIYIFVELNEKGIDYINEINKIQFTDEEKKYLDETSIIRRAYVHYATCIIEPKLVDIMNLTDFIYSQITKTPLKDIFIKIENLLNNKV